MAKLRRVRIVENVARMEEMRNACRLLMVKPGGKKLL
jgi:hypothetical protein